MRPLRTLVGVWRRASFSIKFAAVILVAGVMIAIVPLLITQSNARQQALDRAADKAGIAVNLIQGQRTALDAFIVGVARQVAAARDLTDLTALTATLTQDSGVNAGSDVLGVITANGQAVAVQRGAPLSTTDPEARELSAAASTGQSTAADSTGQPWLLAESAVPGSTAIAFVGRPITTAFIVAVDHNVATSVDPADLSVVRGGRFAVAGTVAGHAVSAGQTPDSKLGSVITSSTAAVLTLSSTDVAVAADPLGAGFALVVTTPVDVLATSWQPILLLVGLIVVAMLFIIVVVQTDLQRPLRRLDRAVAALGRGEFDLPVPTGTEDEVNRLAETFEAMRRQLQATIRATDARAAVATELSASQPLEKALASVCAALRSSMKVDAVIIGVAGSEMNDPFAIVDGVPDIDVDVFLSGDGPLGEGYRLSSQGALLVSAAPASQEAGLDLREFCVSPLRLASHINGVVAVANRTVNFLPSDADLVSSIAEQVALALERYRFLAVVQRQASIDDLTGLYNHRFLVDYLGQQVALAERLSAPLAILMLDIDHFKVLNDTHGHQAGDTALAAFAQTLVNSVRRSDLAARYGGEEFSVVMANTSAREARLVAEKIRTAVAETRMELPDHQVVSLTVSIGGAAYPEDTDSARELLSVADEALYRAKRTGRDRTCMKGDLSSGSGRGRRKIAVVHTPDPKDAGSNVSAGRNHRSSE